MKRFLNLAVLLFALGMLCGIPAQALTLPSIGGDHAQEGPFVL